MNPHGLAACGFEVLRGFSFWHSPRDVNRITDEKILPENFYSASVRRTRFFESHACVFICFYFESADRLTREERLRAITTASHQFLKWTRNKTGGFEDEPLPSISSHSRTAQGSKSRSRTTAPIPSKSPLVGTLCGEGQEADFLCPRFQRALDRSHGKLRLHTHRQRPSPVAGNHGGLEEKLAPHHFIRVRKSAIVNGARISEIRPMFDGVYDIVLAEGTVVTSSRRYAHKLRALLNPSLLRQS